jgi:hypothetical protein
MLSAVVARSQQKTHEVAPVILATLAAGCQQYTIHVRPSVKQKVWKPQGNVREEEQEQHNHLDDYAVRHAAINRPQLPLLSKMVNDAGQLACICKVMVCWALAG